MLSYSIKEKAGLTINLPGGGSLSLRPVTTPSFDAAKAAARKEKGRLLADPEALRAIGIDPEADKDDKEVMDGLFLSLLVAELGVRHVTGWAGVADETGEKDAEVTPENIRRLLRHPLVAKEFYLKVLENLLPDVQLKKDSGTVAAGTSAAVPPTAKDAASEA
jgi:hypothetical protein